VDSWKKDANLVIEPDVNGFAYDCFERTPELIAAGEAAMRSVLPQVRTMLSLQPSGKPQKISLVSPVRPSPAT
jgi:hypothetical protein